MEYLIKEYPTLFDEILPSWHQFFNKPKVVETLDKYLPTILEVKDKNLCPPKEDIFNVFRYTDMDDIKVIIIGQDPYPTKGDAHGLSFSSKSNIIPPPLKNIYNCLHNTGCIDTIPTIGDLTMWARQGVFLYNISLTTYIGTPEYHKKYWATFTNLLLSEINTQSKGKGISVMLWGNDIKAYKDKGKTM